MTIIGNLGAGRRGGPIYSGRNRALSIRKRKVVTLLEKLARGLKFPPGEKNVPERTLRNEAGSCIMTMIVMLCLAIPVAGDASTVARRHCKKNGMQDQE